MLPGMEATITESRNRVSHPGCLPWRPSSQAQHRARCSRTGEMDILASPGTIPTTLPLPRFSKHRPNFQS